MRLKLAISGSYALAVFLPLGLGSTVEQAESKIIKLDQNGERGIVKFDHRSHETQISPDRLAPHQAKPGAACSGCHHTVSPRGIPQLWKCAVCHRSEGDSKNPKNASFDEVHTKRAFHNLCIACHRAENSASTLKKAPVACGDCHESIIGN